MARLEAQRGDTAGESWQLVSAGIVQSLWMVKPCSGYAVFQSDRARLGGEALNDLSSAHERQTQLCSVKRDL